MPQLPLLAIDIHIDPTIVDLGSFTLAWHGFFSAAGIIAGVWLAVRMARIRGLDPNVAQEIALVGVPCAIIGARLFYVAEHWDTFSDNPLRIVTGMAEGGITLYGGLIGGVLGGLAYGLYRRLPVLPFLDVAAPGMILGQAVGRLGCLINGEQRASPTDLPWAVEYTHPNTLGELGAAVHPTAGYEVFGDLVILATLLLVVARVARQPGWVFAWYLLLYAGMRASISQFRLDEADAFGAAIPQLVGIGVIAAALVLSVYLATGRRVSSGAGRAVDAESHPPPDDGRR